MLTPHSIDVRRLSCTAYVATRRMRFISRHMYTQVSGLGFGSYIPSTVLEGRRGNGGAVEE
jgi:hypothetical protein